MPRTTLDFRAATLDIAANPGTDITWRVTIADEGITAGTITCTVGSQTPVVDTSQSITGMLIVDITLSDMQTTALGIGSFDWSLSNTVGGVTTRYVVGSFTQNNRGNSSNNLSALVTATTGTATVQTLVSTSAATAIAAHLIDPTDAHDATAVSVLDTGGYYAGADAETVLAYLGKRAADEYHLGDYGTVDRTGATASDTALTAALAAMYAAGGGTLVFPSGKIRFDNQIVIPNDSATPYPNQPSMIWRGAGAWADGLGGSGPYPSPAIAGGTIIDMRYTGGGTGLAKIDTRGKNNWEITGITFADLGTSTNPYLKTTNTALQIHHCAFTGNPTKAGLTCDQDAIILGGNEGTGLPGSGPNAGFQGYGTVISQNYAARIRRFCLLQDFANGIIIRDNNIWVSCGNSTGGAIELYPSGGSGSIFGNVIAGNLIETGYYKYGIYVNAGQSNTFAFNNFYDSTATTTAYIRFDTSEAKTNVVISGYGSTAYTHVSESVPGVNSVMNFNYTQTSTMPFPWRFLRGMQTGVLYTSGAGNPEITLDAPNANPPGIYAMLVGTPAFAANPGSLCVVKTGVAGGQLWVKEYGLSTTGWGRVNTAIAHWRTRTAKTGNYTLGDDNVVTFNGSSLTATLPTAASIDGRVYTIKNINASTLTIATTSSQTIDGAAPGTLAQWALLRVMSDGANWLTV